MGVIIQRHLLYIYTLIDLKRAGYFMADMGFWKNSFRVGE